MTTTDDDEVANLVDTYCAESGTTRDQAREMIADLCELWNIPPGDLPALVAEVQHEGFTPGHVVYTLLGLPRLVATRTGAELVLRWAFSAARHYGVLGTLLDKLRAYVRPRSSETRH